MYSSSPATSQESKRHLCELGALSGLGSMVKEIATDEDYDDYDTEEGSKASGDSLVADEGEERLERPESNILSADFSTNWSLIQIPQGSQLWKAHGIQVHALHS